MSADDAVLAEPCVNHPRRETVLHCGRCGSAICTKCMVQTPVGVRCRTCARLRRLPQFDVGPWLLVRSGLAGLGTSILAWYIVSYFPFLRLFLSILVGLAVGEVMSRLAQRRISRPLEVVAVMVVVAGIVIVDGMTLSLYGASPLVLRGALLTIGISAVLASAVAVIKLR